MDFLHPANCAGLSGGWTWRHLTLQASLSSPFPLNSAVIGYTVEGVLLIFAHLTAETTVKSRAVSARHKNLQKVRGLELWMSTRC